MTSEASPQTNDACRLSFVDSSLAVYANIAITNSGIKASIGRVLTQPHAGNEQRRTCNAPPFEQWGGGMCTCLNTLTRNLTRL